MKRLGKSNDFLNKIYKIHKIFLNYMTDSCIEISGNENEILLNAYNRKVKFSLQAIEAIYTHQLLEKTDLIWHIKRFKNFRIDLIYPHRSFHSVFKQLTNIKNWCNKKIPIGIVYKGVDKTDTFFYSKLRHLFH